MFASYVIWTLFTVGEYVTSPMFYPFGYIIQSSLIIYDLNKRLFLKMFTVRVSVFLIHVMVKF